jgi:hypothetical protein
VVESQEPAVDGGFPRVGIGVGERECATPALDEATASATAEDADEAGVDICLAILDLDFPLGSGKAQAIAEIKPVGGR